MSAEKRFAELALELPEPGRPMGVYRPVLVVGDLAYFSGHGPLMPDGKMITGRVGEDLSLEEGFAAARQTGLAMLATLREHFGGLEPMERLVKTFGMVQCSPSFQDIPAVINGFSELMRDVFGEDRGVAARSAVGMNALPGNIPVEIECVFQIKQ